MLGKKTNCDLSAGIAKLDLEKLTKQVEIHFYSLMEKIRRKSSSIINDSLKIEDRKDSLSSMSATGADEFTRLSESLAETTELLHTLYNTTDREIIIE